MATARSRPRGRENARPPAGGVAAEHATKIYGVAIGCVVVMIAFLALTSTGHVIDAATQHFMLYYAGVFTLIALCLSVALGLIATDRMILQPGHRIFVQSAHRAASFGAVSFLLIHITTEILAQRVHLLDSVVPFLSPFRTFYIGLGTIASDLILLIVITSIVRKRFTAHGKAWRWRAIHYTSYVSFVFGVWHGLLGGRAGKPYVDWSYGFVVALVALGLAIRILANSLRPKENLSGPPVADSASSGSATMRAASMFAQLSLVRAASSSTVLAPSGQQPQGMLSAQVDSWDTGWDTGSTSAFAALPPPAETYGSTPYGYDDGRQPYYEPGYEGPPRYMGAPRRADSGPLPRATTGPLPRVGPGPVQARNSGPLPRATTGPLPRVGPGPVQARNSGPLPRATTGPLPRVGPGPVQARNSGPLPRATTGPIPRAENGTGQGRGNRPMPGSTSGPMPRAATGPMPQAPGGPLPQGRGRPVPGRDSGPMPRAATGPMPVAGNGRASRPDPSMPSGAHSAQQPRAQRGGAQPGGGRPEHGRAVSADWTEPPGWANVTSWDSNPGWANVTSWDWNPGKPPWEGGAPMPDPSFGYREPGPGMPGYRVPRDPFTSGDEYR